MPQDILLFCYTLTEHHSLLFVDPGVCYATSPEECNELTHQADVLNQYFVDIKSH